MKNRGDGRIFQRRGSTFLWCAYYLRGKEYRESTGETDEKKAGKYLKRRLKEVGADQIGAKSFIGPQQERLTVSELLDALKADYGIREIDTPQFRSHLKHVRDHFGSMRAMDVTAEQVDRFIQERLEKYAPATINRSTQLLSQAYALAVERKRLASAPVIRHLSEAGNVRQGFFTDAEFRAVVEGLPEYLKDFASFAYYTGMRKGEVASLRWEDVEGDVISLRAENAKNGEARSVPLEGELAELIERRRTARRVKKGQAVMLAAWVFHRDGEAVGDFRKAWATACVIAGIGKLLCPVCDSPTDAERKCGKCSKTWQRDQLKYTGRCFHDFRRTAVRDMVRAGVPETVAMSISGHKTRSMFDRYNITNERDRREALRQTQEYRQQQAANQSARVQ
jgi:integrase